MPSGKASKRKRRNGSEEAIFEKYTTKYNGKKFGEISIKQVGPNLLVSNRRTSDQQRQFLEQLALDRPKVLVSIESQISEVISMFKEYNNFLLLGGLEAQHIANQFNPQDDGISEVNLEYGLSFATALDGNPAKIPTSAVLIKLIKLLTAIRHTYNQYVMTENANGNMTLIDANLRYKTILQALFVRGDGYTKHIYKIFKQIYSGHDSFLVNNYGFNSTQILDTILQLEDSFCCRLAYSNGNMHKAAYERFSQWLDKSKVTPIPSLSLEQFSVENPDLIIKDNKIFAYNISEIQTYGELFKIRFREDIHLKVADRICLNFGDNKDFLNPKFKSLPLMDSEVYSKPIIKHGDDYYLFSFSLPTRNLFNITESLIKNADPKYYNEKFLGNKYALSRDNSLEQITADLFKKIIPESNSFLNLKYKVDDPKQRGKKIETELDLLVISSQANYLIEMKAGGLSTPAKRGALKSLSGNLSDLVGYGAFQNFRALKYIIEENIPEFYDYKGAKVSVDKTKKNFRITITLEHLSSLIAYMYDLKELGIIDKNVDFAWTCSIFDLLVFSEILEKEQDFVDYLEKRIPLYLKPELDFHDEIHVLGYFLEKDLIFDSEMIKNRTRFQITGFANKIDNYFQRGGEKPIREYLSKKIKPG